MSVADPPRADASGRGAAFSGAVHIASVEVDADTGRVDVRGYTVVEDCGPVINPTIVEGQIHGALAQGIGEALGEELVYDERGQLLTGTLMDYAMPVASALPAFVVGHLETPSPHTPGGMKGMGEGGTVGAPAWASGEKRGRYPRASRYAWPSTWEPVGAVLRPSRWKAAWLPTEGYPTSPRRPVQGGQSRTRPTGSRRPLLS